MKAVIFLAGLLAIVSAELTENDVKVGKDGKRNQEDEEINFDEIFGSKRLYNSYFNCVMTAKKCTGDGRKIRDFLLNTVKTDCGKCTETEKGNADKLLGYMFKNKLKDFKKFEKLYDPERGYRKRISDKLKGDAMSFSRANSEIRF